MIKYLIFIGLLFLFIKFDFKEFMGYFFCLLKQKIHMEIQTIFSIPFIESLSPF